MLDPAVCEHNLKSSLHTVLPSPPRQVQDGLSRCRTALTLCLGVVKDEQLFLLYKYVVLLVVYLAVRRSQRNRTRRWGSRNIASEVD